MALIELILEGVRVDGVEPQAQTLGLSPQRRIVLHTVPREMRRDAWRHAAQLLHDGTVCELLVDVGRRAGEREFRKARASTTGAPRRQRDGEGCDLALDEPKVDAATTQLSAECVVLIEKRVVSRLIVTADQGDRERLSVHDGSVTSTLMPSAVSTSEGLGVACIHVQQIACGLCRLLGSKEVD